MRVATWGLDLKNGVGRGKKEERRKTRAALSLEPRDLTAISAVQSKLLYTGILEFLSNPFHGPIF
jgi:hypothetical protein